MKLNHKELIPITGIFADLPTTSTFQFEVIMSYDKFLKENKWLENSGSNSPPTYATLVEDANSTEVSQKIADFVKKSQFF